MKITFNTNIDLIISGPGRRRFRNARWAAVAASAVMLVVYLVPHSMFGSELDYAKVDSGLDPQQAIKTGR